MADCGQRTTAREMLAQVHDWFTEGADTFDLIAAKRLLADLSN
jgi:hypothetical protein